MPPKHSSTLNLLPANICCLKTSDRFFLTKCVPNMVYLSQYIRVCLLETKLHSYLQWFYSYIQADATFATYSGHVSIFATCSQCSHLQYAPIVCVWNTKYRSGYVGVATGDCVHACVYVCNYLYISKNIISVGKAIILILYYVWRHFSFCISSHDKVTSWNVINGHLRSVQCPRSLNTYAVLIKKLFFFFNLLSAF